MNKIFIYSGKIKSGKTTRLLQWAARQKNIDGIFQLVIEDKRFVYHYSSRTLRCLEIKLPSTKKETTVKEEADIYSIGKYHFSKETFEWTRNILKECIKKDLDWLIIDEVGPLELKGQGIEPAVADILMNSKKFHGRIIFVVRESLIGKFVEHFSLENKFEEFRF